jgi:hypothetical protein
MSNKPESREFFIESNFQKLARRPGGVTRNQAVKRAQVLIDRLKPEFKDWLDQELKRLGTAIRRAEDDSRDRSALRDACRSCRELRDVGTTMGYKLLTYIADNLCLAFEAIKAGATYDKKLINGHVNALHLAREEPYRRMRPDEVPGLSRRDSQKTPPGDHAKQRR